MWSMHFVAMDSVNWYTPNGTKMKIRYRIDYTIVSLFIPIFLAYIGIYICSKDKAFTEERSDVLGEFVKNAEQMSIQELKAMKSANYVLSIALFRSLHRIIIGGVVTALGVSIMHFLGMSAIVTDAKIEWNGGVVFSSVLVASVASVTGYWILFRLISLYPRREILRLTSALVIAMAVTAMHFSGAAAAKFIYVDGAADLIRESETGNSGYGCSHVVR
jgi:NO-binding membrane sensor protein with MHYT domain